jgi:hypothetical protein
MSGRAGRKSSWAKCRSLQLEVRQMGSKVIRTRAVGPKLDCASKSPGLTPPLELKGGDVSDEDLHL